MLGDTSYDHLLSSPLPLYIVNLVKVTSETTLSQ